MLSSLIEHFDAPEGCLGLFGWLCGYSADADFLDEAATRFTGQNASSRASQGRLALALMLDRHNRQITTVPGVAHLPVLPDAPFNLLHAKVALLGFRKEDDPEDWCLRLLVSTGNWTRQTLEQSLDLIWRLDLTRNEINGEDCADIRAAWNFFKALQKYCQTSLVTRAEWSGHENLKTFQEWIDACARNAKGHPRFFDNRKKSLLDQLVEKIAHGSKIRRNYLALGSGFYETVSEDKNVMEVPGRILEKLQDGKLLTKNPEMDLFVNEKRCQGVAAAFADLRARGFTIRPPHQPESFGKGCRRDLHAKFLFSAREMEKNNHCTNPWVYLGSGNLTLPGFTRGMKGYNLEAGVVFFPGNNVYWDKEKAPEDACVVSELLPLQRGNEIKDSECLQAGEGFPPKGEDFAAPPLAWLRWQVSEDGGQWLTSEEELPPELEELQAQDQGEWQPYQEEKKGFIWKGPQPRQVLLRWKSAGREAKALIPVLDQYGRVAARELTPLDLAGVWGELADFPRPPAEEESELEELDNEQDSWGQNGHAPEDKPGGPLHSDRATPIREMMELLENIAERQTSLPKGDWKMWCQCLEPTLCRCGGSEPVRYFREELKLNPLYPLYQAPFRPDFAACSASEESQFYEECLHRIEKNWKAEGLAPLGGNNAPEAREEKV